VPSTLRHSRSSIALSSSNSGTGSRAAEIGSRASFSDAQPFPREKGLGPGAARREKRRGEGERAVAADAAACWGTPIFKLKQLGVESKSNESACPIESFEALMFVEPLGRGHRAPPEEERGRESCAVAVVVVAFLVRCGSSQLLKELQIPKRIFSL
jgi:hypothetical protein